MRFRRIAVAAALATAVAVPAASTAAAAASQPTTASHHGDKADKTDKAGKKTKFAASGTVTAVDAVAGTVTMKVKGGTKDVRRATVTITVPSSARIVVNGGRRPLADIAAGYGISVTGTHDDATYTASRVEARGKKAHPAKPPATSPTTTPTSPTGPATTPAPSTSPSDDVTPEPADSESPAS
jgi:hypothetical protein